MLGRTLIDRWEMWKPAIDQAHGPGVYPMFEGLVEKLRRELDRPAGGAGRLTRSGPSLALAQSLASLKHRLEIGEDVRPPLADGLQDLAAGLEALVGHRELDELAEVVDLEGDPGAWLGRDALEELFAEADTLGRLRLAIRV